jgi:hypothetical protein
MQCIEMVVNQCIDPAPRELWIVMFANNLEQLLLHHCLAHFKYFKMQRDKICLELILECLWVVQKVTSSCPFIYRKQLYKLFVNDLEIRYIAYIILIK